MSAAVRPCDGNDDSAAKEKESSPLPAHFSKAAICSAVTLPVVLVLLVALGLPKLEVETQLSNFWMREGSEFAKSGRYASEMEGIASNSLLLMVATPRNGGNMLTKDYLLRLAARLKETVETKITMFGHEFTYEDVCYNVAGEYILPCMRYNLLDCFKEGDYDLQVPRHSQSWEALLYNSQVKPNIKAAKAALLPDVTLTCLGLALTVCIPMAACEDAKLPHKGPGGTIKFPPWELDASTGFWPESAACHACLAEKLVSMSAMSDFIRYQVISTLWGAAPASLTGGRNITELKKEFGTSVDNDAWDIALLGLIEKIMISNIGYVGKTPYTWNSSYAPVIRPSLASADLTQAQIFETVSKKCCLFDACSSLPPVNKYLTVGGVAPKIAQVDGSSPAKTFTLVEAIQSVLIFDTKNIATRVGRSIRPGGPVTISQDQSKELLAAFKKKYEEVYSRDWDSSDGPIEFTAWADDAGAAGSTSRMLDEVGTESFKQAAVLYVIIVIVSGCFFIDFNQPLTQSRFVLCAVGAIQVILGMFAAIGINCLLDIKLTISSSYTMPFVMVGILCDDMYMLTLSVDIAQEEAGPDTRWFKAIRAVGVPITVTSAINFGVFTAIFACNDLPAVYDIGSMGMIATVTLYITVMLSYTVLVYFDLKRRYDGRYECLCCIGGPTKSADGNCLIPEARSPLFERVYKPIAHSLPIRIVFILSSVALFAFSLGGLTNIEVGLNLDDLFQDGSQARQFIEQRMKYFPVWPSQIKWGALDYTSAQTQMQMVWQFEKVAATEYIAPGLLSNDVWTALFSTWCMQDRVIRKADTTFDAVATATVNECRASWAENSLDLRLQPAGGVCHNTTSTFPDSFTDANGTLTPQAAKFTSTAGCSTKKGCCPVFSGTDKQWSDCLKYWATYTTGYSKTSPGFPGGFENGVQMPIVFSRAGGNTMFAFDLYETKDYTKLMEQTREFVDDNAAISGTHSHMSGIAFNYWEQYLTLEELLYSIAGIAVSAGAGLAWVFLFVELTINKFGSVPQRLLATFVGALCIAFVMMASMLTVLGLTCWADVQLSAFTALSCLLASGFAIEYAVHVVHHFLEAQEESTTERVVSTMEFLFSPTMMSVVSSGLSVLALAFSGFDFITRFFFMPLIFATLVTYFYGIITLPFVLSVMSFLPRLTQTGAQKAETTPISVIPVQPKSETVTQTVVQVQVQVQPTPQNDECC